MRDGTKLAAKLWIPELVEKSASSVEEEKYPAILGEDLYIYLSGANLSIYNCCKHIKFVVQIYGNHFKALV